LISTGLRSRSRCHAKEPIDSAPAFQHVYLVVAGDPVAVLGTDGISTAYSVSVSVLGLLEKTYARCGCRVEQPALVGRIEADQGTVGEIDDDACSAIDVGVGHRVAIAAVDVVVTEAAEERILVVPSIEMIVARAAKQRVVAGAVVEPVVAGVAIERVLVIGPVMPP
jgi:hypothetical protein